MKRIGIRVEAHLSGQMLSERSCAVCSADIYCPHNHLQINIPNLKTIGIGVEAHLSGQILSEISFAIQILAFLTDIQPVTEDWGKSYKIQVFCFWHWSQTFHQQGRKLLLD